MNDAKPGPVVPADMANIRRAAQILRAGGLVAFPTETVYGLGADALSATAVQKIFGAKGRPATNPIIVHVADIAVAKSVGADWPSLAQQLATRFWPGPLTLVLPRRLDVPDQVTAGGLTVGVRVPNHPVALALLHEFGGPIAAPSANRSTEISPTTAQHVEQSLGDRVDWILDGGPCSGGIESTVLDVSIDPPRILRPGMITSEDLNQALGYIAVLQSQYRDVASPLRSPGMMERHYAPRTPLELAIDDGVNRVKELIQTGIQVGWLAWATSPRISGARRMEMPIEPAEYASRLYAVLHELDAAGVDRIIVAAPPDWPEWLAIRDRLTRAAHE